MSHQDISVHGSLQVPFHYYLMNCLAFLENIVEWFLIVLFIVLEFRDFLLLNWLPPKIRMFSLLCYLTQSWEEKRWILFLFFALITNCAIHISTHPLTLLLTSKTLNDQSLAKLIFPLRKL